MGCAASRLENEDTVRRCRDRRRLMRDAVQSRHHLASAHADYLHALRVAGAALTAFARGEPLAVSDHASPILLPSPSLSSTTLPPPTPQPPQPPAPPQRRFSPSPSPTITSSKLPHILSASSAGSTPKYKPPPSAKGPTYATTPSQASSSLDWDNLYPPSPPDSEYFDRIKREREEMEAKWHHLEVDEEEEEEAMEREEVQCSEWGDRYGGATTSSSDGAVDEEMREMGQEPGYGGVGATRSEYGGSSSSVSGETRSRAAPSKIGSAAAQKLGRREGSEVGSFSTVGGGGGGGLGLVVRHRDLAEIVAAIEEYFIRAASAGEPVSDLLESGRAQLDRSFRQLKSQCSVNAPVTLS